jgi:hypothetical protein
MYPTKLCRWMVYLQNTDIVNEILQKHVFINNPRSNENHDTHEHSGMREVLDSGTIIIHIHVHVDQDHKDFSSDLLKI